MRIASSTGMANEMPMLPPVPDRICELMPITSPRMLISGPPELPGLTATSVWMNGSSSPVSRLLALTMPAVTVFSSPNGEPIARTHWPTRIAFESPIAMRGRPLGLDLDERDVAGACRGRSACP